MLKGGLVGCIRLNAYLGGFVFFPFRGMSGYFPHVANSQLSWPLILATKISNNFFPQLVLLCTSYTSVLLPGGPGVNGYIRASAA